MQLAQNMLCVGLVAGTDRTSHVYCIDNLCFLDKKTKKKETQNLFALENTTR